MTAPDPRDLLTRALIATDHHARLSARWIRGDKDITKADLRKSQDDMLRDQLAAYMAWERAMAGVSA
jgi:hypothetical protein